MWASPAVTARDATGPPCSSPKSACCCYERGTAAVRTVVAGWPAEARVSASSAAGCCNMCTHTHTSTAYFCVFPPHPAPSWAFSVFFYGFVWNPL